MVVRIEKSFMKLQKIFFQDNLHPTVLRDFVIGVHSVNIR